MGDGWAHLVPPGAPGSNWPLLVKLRVDVAALPAHLWRVARQALLLPLTHSPAWRALVSGRGGGDDGQGEGAAVLPSLRRLWRAAQRRLLPAALFAAPLRLPGAALLRGGGALPPPSAPAWRRQKQQAEKRQQGGGSGGGGAVVVVAPGAGGAVGGRALVAAAAEGGGGQRVCLAAAAACGEEEGACCAAGEGQVVDGLAAADGGSGLWCPAAEEEEAPGWLGRLRGLLGGLLRGTAAAAAQGGQQGECEAPESS